MAIYHLRVSNVSRAAGSSAVAAASYITSRRMRDERTGVTSYGYGRRERVEHVGTLLPKGAPDEWRDPERLFNAAEKAERAANARPAKKIVVALPREFDAATRIRAVEDFAALNLAAKGYACTYAIHTDKAGNNPHAHIIVANRRIDPESGTWAKTKARKAYALDERGERIPVIDPKTGRQKLGRRNERLWKRVTVSANPLDSKDFLKKLRADWAETCNLLLPQGTRIDHRSLRAQGIDREPTIHEGYAAREIEKRGGTSVLMQRNRAIRSGNARYARLKADLMRLRDGMRAAMERLMRRLAGAPRNAATAPEPPAEIFAGPDKTKRGRGAAAKPTTKTAEKPAPPEKPVKAPQKPERTKTGTGAPEAFEKRLRDRLRANLAASQKKQAAGRLARPRHHGR